MKNSIWLACNLVSWGFLGRWFRIRSQNLKIQNVGSNMAEWNHKIQFDLHESWNLGIFQIADIKSRVKIQEFKMADPIWWNKIAKYNLIYIKLGICSFFKSLISNKKSNLKNSKLQIQHGRLKSQNITWFIWKSESRSF